MTMLSSSKVIVGLSGGVDSSVAAMLLQQQGYVVEGLFMKNWEDSNSEGHCTASQDIADAKHVCEKLGIVLHTVNFSDEYWENVFHHFLAEHQAGRTPNPDILCNREIKFKVFLDHAQKLGANFIATGHYAQIQQHEGHYHLLQGSDKNKDQSYFLYTLNENQLAKSLFPLGELEKSQVRSMAEKAGFLNHSKKDSTGICFIGERKFKHFLSQYLPAKPGDILTLAGKKLGRHDGLMYYTIGQRKGLHIGGQAHEPEAPWYVADKVLAKNQLIVVQGHDHAHLFSPGLICQEVHWINGMPPSFPFVLQAKTRYRQPQQIGKIMPIGSAQYQVMFDKPQWAITPGQSVVFYQNALCLGGGIISAAIKET